MTDKEALEKLLDALKHWQGRNTIFDKIHSKHILDELDQLTKYKRAFEILKEKGFNGKEVITRSFSGYRVRKLINEEAELLEELMKDE